MSNRELRVAVIQPRLDGQGGLEKYGVFVIDTLAQRMPVDVISEHQVDPAVVERAFGVRLERPRLIHDQRCCPPPCESSGLALRKERWQAQRDFAALTGQYSLVISQAIGLPLRSAARRSVMLCHFPVVRNQKIDRAVPKTGLQSWVSSRGREQREIRTRLASWNRVIVNSSFTSKWVDRYWARQADIINPPIELPPPPDLSVKKQWIIGVGFFGKPQNGEPWSYKRQELLIDTFRAMCDAGLAGWELHLAGHVLPPTPDVHAYVAELARRCEGYPIRLHPNCSHAELLALYRHGTLFWHATGYGADEESHPERMEHFGMVTAEAMGWGCVPVAVNRGGQPEIVEPQRSGMLWDTTEQLRVQTLSLIGKPEACRKVAEAAVTRAQTFGLERFRRQINTLVDEELAQVGSRSAARQQLNEAAAAS